MDQRFELIRQLGTGGMGAVYHARDHKLGRDVALKTLHVIEPASLHELKREFRSLVDVSHPNLVELYELFAEPDRCFFTMELIDGDSLLSHLWGGADHRDGSIPEWTAASLAPVRAMLAQLTRGVMALHACGQLHCDIKPANVMVTRSGRVVLLDFGLAVAAQSGDAERRAAEPPVGTIAFMSPEQALGIPVDAAADWYAVGGLLYGILTGQPPFPGPAIAVFYAKCALQRPEPPQTLAPSIPDDLAALVLGLLEPTAALRAGAREVLAWLGEGPRTGPASVPPPVSAAIVGRDEELARLDEALARSREGRRQIVRVSGRSGIGKTALVTAFLAGARDRHGAILLSGRCHLLESIPFKGIDGVIDGVARHVRALRPTDTPPPHGGIRALARLFPAVFDADERSLPADVNAAHDPVEARRHASAALRTILAAMARDRATIVWIDDAQWCDQDGAGLLSEVFSTPDAPQVLLVLTHRSETSAALAQLVALTDGLPSVDARVLELGPLDAAASERVLRDALTIDPAQDSPLLGEILREAAGSPFVLQTLARHAVDAVAVPGSPLTGQRLAAVLGARVAVLPAQQRRILELIALAGRPLDRALVLDAVGLHQDDRGEVAALCQALLLRRAESTRRTQFETFHDRVRDAVRGLVSPADVIATHRLIAAAVQRSTSPDPEQIAEHLLLAGDRAAAGEHVLEAARRAERALAFDRASDWYRRALESDSTILPRWQLLERLATCATNLGHGRESGRLYDDAASAAQDAVTRRWLQQRAATQYLRCGCVHEGVERYRVVLHSLGVKIPRSDLRAQATSTAGRLELLLRGLDFTPRPESALSPLERERLDALWNSSSALAHVQHVVADALGVQHLVAAIRLGQSVRVARALGYEAVSEVVLFGGSFRGRVEALLRRSDEIAAATADPYDVAWLGQARASIAWFDGRWAQCVEGGDLAGATFRTLPGLNWELAMVDTYSLSALARLGRLRELAARCETALADARVRDDRYRMATSMLGDAAFAWLRRGAWRESIEEGRAILDGVPAGLFTAQHHHQMLAATRAELYGGEVHAARARLETAWPQLRSAGFLLLRCVNIDLRYLRGLTALALARLDRRRRAALLAEARQEAKTIARDSVTSAAGFAAALRAGAADVAGDAGTAAAQWHEAIEGFQRAGMAMHREAARASRGAAHDPAEVARAHAWMRSEGVVEPVALARAVGPTG